ARALHELREAREVAVLLVVAAGGAVLAIPRGAGAAAEPRVVSRGAADGGEIPTIVVASRALRGELVGSPRTEVVVAIDEAFARRGLVRDVARVVVLLRRAAAEGERESGADDECVTMAGSELHGDSLLSPSATRVPARPLEIRRGFCGSSPRWRVPPPHKWL